MMARRYRLLRSHAFWFGVPGLVFLLWAWGLSRTHWSSVEFHGSAGDAVLGQVDGDAFFVCHGSPDWSTAEGRHLRLNSAPAEPLKRMLRSSRRPGERSFFVSHGILFFAYLHLWIGLLIWRKWKYRPLPEVEGVE